MHVLILGAGFSGQAIATAMMRRAHSVTGTTRAATKREALEALGIRPLIFDGETIGPELAEAMARTTHLVQSIAPGAAGDPLFRADRPPLAAMMPNLAWAGYLSTVGVYGDHDGAWVDEDTPCRPASTRSLERIAAEDAWLGFSRESGIPVAVLRLSGIYGPGRNALCNLAEGTARRLVKPGQVFNRIRVEDIGAVTDFLAARGLGGVYNVTDDSPGPPQDVVAYAADLMGVERPPAIAFENAVLSEMARSFYGENKRVSNARLRGLGFTFRFPDYRMSLEDLWRTGRWSG
ncbi:SDR family oxidoreductase [Ensifer soli]|uniref:SDR family oxidoreductase n=1 Tax=Ciceribacter sp. sgz301302 TaxID=3342379 RepID=UPI0035B9D089